MWLELLRREMTRDTLRSQKHIVGTSYQVFDVIARVFIISQAAGQWGNVGKMLRALKLEIWMLWKKTQSWQEFPSGKRRPACFNTFAGPWARTIPRWSRKHCTRWKKYLYGFRRAARQTLIGYKFRLYIEQKHNLETFSRKYVYTDIKR